MKISKYFFTGILCLGFIFSNSQKISVGGFKSSGLTETEINELKSEIDLIIESTEGFSLINSGFVNKKLNEDSTDLLDCISSACSHEISHIFNFLV